jgi:hypothetical protein
MPPKKNPETQAEQSARFKRDAKELVKAGELSLTDADAALDNIVRRSANVPKKSTSG